MLNTFKESLLLQFRSPCIAIANFLHPLRYVGSWRKGQRSGRGTNYYKDNGDRWGVALVLNLAMPIPLENCIFLLIL